MKKLHLLTLFSLIGLSTPSYAQTNSATQPLPPIYNKFQSATKVEPRIIFECRAGYLSAQLIMDSIATTSEVAITYELADPFSTCNFVGYAAYNLSQYYQLRLSGRDETNTQGKHLLQEYENKIITAFQSYTLLKNVALTAGYTLYNFGTEFKYHHTGTYRMECMSNSVRFIQEGDRQRYGSNWKCTLPNHTPIGEIQELELNKNGKPASNLDIGLIYVPNTQVLPVFKDFPSKLQLHTLEP
jgi:hypothetical protein